MEPWEADKGHLLLGFCSLLAGLKMIINLSSIKNGLEPITMRTQNNIVNTNLIQRQNRSRKHGTQGQYNTDHMYMGGCMRDGGAAWVPLI